MEDYTAFNYPSTNYDAPTKFESHGEFLRDASLRHNIANELHKLNTEDMMLLMDFIQMIVNKRQIPD